MVKKGIKMKAISFDVYGKIAHFRRPDTTATQLTYPFITPTAAKGLVGSILGIEDFQTTDKIGVQLVKPVHTVAQRMSMLGKDSGRRPTTIELIVQPHYRIYYVGGEYGDLLAEYLQNEHFIYHTYLGSVYALTRPFLHQVYNNVISVDLSEDVIKTSTVVPTVLIKELHFEPDRYYSRAGGFLLHYKGNREFEYSINMIYERNGKTITFTPNKGPYPIDVNIASLDGEIVCLY